jgi:hypothetical protein
VIGQAGKLRYYKDERTANEVTRSKAKAAAISAWGADAVQAQSCSPPRAQSSSSEGIISIDSICAVFNEPGKKGGCSIKLIGKAARNHYPLLYSLCSMEARVFAREMQGRKENTSLSHPRATRHWDG